MGDLISREAVWKLLNMEHPMGFNNDDIAEAFRNAPAVDAEPVRHEKWAHLGGDEWYCTGCGEVIHTEGSWERPTKKFCHECGAKMDKEVNT